MPEFGTCGFRRRAVAPAMVRLLVAALLTLHTPIGSGEDLVVQRVERSQRSALPAHTATWATAANDVGEVRDDLPLSRLTLVLKRSAQQQRAFDDFLRRQQDPDSPDFHRWLTPVEVGERFGASPHDIDALTQWLDSRGMHVDAVANSRMRIAFSGPAATVAAAFGTRMHAYDVNGARRVAPVEVPQIPAALSPIVQSVRGLITSNERPSYRAGALQLYGKESAAEQPAGTNCLGVLFVHDLFPGDFATIYDVKPVYQQGIDGRGQTIAIIGRSRVYLPDIENFQHLSGLPIKDPVMVVPPGAVDPGPALSTGGRPTPDQLEATLDVARASSIAPGATINLVISAGSTNSTGLDVAAEFVVDADPLVPQIMNLSFNDCEADSGASGVHYWDSLFRQAAAEGISVIVSSGDGGAAGCDMQFSPPPSNQVASPNAVCASSFATCVGGTQLIDSTNPELFWSATNDAGFESALGYIPEGAWNEPLDSTGKPQAAASGGGVSAFIATPYWQTGPGVSGTQGRYTPDVSFSAGRHDGYFTCLAAAGASCVPDSSGRFPYGTFFGTSATAPSMAGIAALLTQKMGGAQGNLNPRLYALAAAPGNGAFHDVTVGTSGVSGCDPSLPSACNNSTPATGALTGGLNGFTVRPGYDEATGLGSIDVAHLLAHWSNGAPALNYQGLWWNADESGWGMNLAHQGDQIFASWYTYDIRGNPWWVSMLANRSPPGSNTFAGPVYVDTGPPFDNFAGAGIPTQVGTGSLSFTDADNGSFRYVLTGGGATNVAQTKTITRFSLGGAQPVCTYAANPDFSAATNFQDLWWNSTEPGWGVNFAHQGNLVFATWYSYGTDGAPIWLSALLTRQGTTSVYTGALARTSGPRFDDYISSALAPAQMAGTATAAFNDGNHASFSYVTNGIGGLPIANQSKAISRFLFAAPAGTACQ